MVVLSVQDECSQQLRLMVKKEKAFTVRNTWRDEFYADGKEFNYFHKECKFCSFLIFEDETTGCEIERNISV